VIAGETRHTPRILLSLIEHLPEGCAFPAAMAGDPQRRFWRSETAIMAAIHNAVQVNTMVVGNIAKKDRKLFGFIDPPWVKKAPPPPARGARGAFGLLGGKFDTLPAKLKASKSV